MRAIAFVKRLIDEQKLDRGRYKPLHMHMVADDAGMSAFNASSKFNTDWAFLQELHRLGHQAADGWLKAHRDRVGHDSSFDIHACLFAATRPRVQPFLMYRKTGNLNRPQYGINGVTDSISFDTAQQESAWDRIWTTTRWDVISLNSRTRSMN
jgi:hypothetical protein